MAATERSGTFPQSGRVVPELPDLGYREVVSGSYRVVYRAAPEVVWIVAVVPGRQLMTRALGTADEPGGVSH